MNSGLCSNFKNLAESGVTSPEQFVNFSLLTVETFYSTWKSGKSGSLNMKRQFSSIIGFSNALLRKACPSAISLLRGVSLSSFSDNTLKSSLCFSCLLESLPTNTSYGSAKAFCLRSPPACSLCCEIRLHRDLHSEFRAAFALRDSHLTMMRIALVPNMIQAP